MRIAFIIFAALLFFLPVQAQTSNIYANNGAYLGNTGSQYDPSSVNNPYGQYGSQYSPQSMRNPYGQYGSQYSPNSPTNPYAQPGSIQNNGYNRPFGGWAGN